MVFTNGCFDLLHIGHITVLEQARRFGDRLIVAINSDASVRRWTAALRVAMQPMATAGLFGESPASTPPAAPIPTRA